LQAGGFVEIPLAFQYWRSHAAFHFLMPLHFETFSSCGADGQSREMLESQPKREPFRWDRSLR
jgi:hypothetical protein